MRAPGWFVVQVQTGCEAQMCRVIERACAEADLASDRDYPLLEECFSPQFQTQMKYHGEWRYKEKPLLPGYVVAVTAEPAALAHLLRGVPEFSRLLTSGETFVPLRDDERVWMEEFTKAGERTIPMSFAYKKGDTLVVTSGALVGREGMITRVSRRKSLAFVEIDVGGKRVTTTVGLGIVGEPNGATKE